MNNSNEPSKYGDKFLQETSTYSKHLMLLVLAIFAMLIPLITKSSNILVWLFLSLTIVLVLYNLLLGQKILTDILKIYLDPKKEVYVFADDTNPIKELLNRQIKASIWSVVFLLSTYGMHIINRLSETDKKEDTLNGLLHDVELLKAEALTAKASIKKLDKAQIKSETIALELNKLTLSADELNGSIKDIYTKLELQKVKQNSKE
jgi:hypothetical protein